MLARALSLVLTGLAEENPLVCQYGGGLCVELVKRLKAVGDSLATPSGDDASTGAERKLQEEGANTIVRILGEQLAVVVKEVLGSSMILI